MTANRGERAAKPLLPESADPIAVIGIGCRFPGAADVERYWGLLRDGKDAITEVPRERWDVGAHYAPMRGVSGKMNTRWGGFLENIDRFDADLFAISADEAAQIDPQQRLLLEVAWEALEHAGIAPSALAGTRTGVFIGLSNSDYDRLVCRDLAVINAFSASGSSPSVAANRISYAFGLRGPSLTIDTACSSSLVAIHLACQSLQRRECDAAIVGGVNLILSPDKNIALSQSGMAAADGLCKSFDERADGFVRSEGCGVVVLKRLADGCVGRDTVHAVIRGTAVNHDGASNGLTAPNGAAQQQLIRDALVNAGVVPGAVSYVDAHATGTRLGDAIEVNALAAVLQEDRPCDRPCWIGSAKTNIGHTEAAAGIAGLIKVVLAFRHGSIPANLHLKTINRQIRVDASRFLIPTTAQPWETPNMPRVAGVSAFGFGGTNAHVVLEEPPAAESAPADARRSRSLLVLSAKTQGALRALAMRYRGWLADNDSALEDICHTAAVGRANFAERLGLIADSTGALDTALCAFLDGRQNESWVAGIATSAPPRLAWVCSGGVGGPAFATLCATAPAVRAAVAECAAVFNESPEALLLQDTPAARFAFPYALGRLWESWGLAPMAIVGEREGAYAAACLARRLNLEEAAARLAVEPTAELVGPALTHGVELVLVLGGAPPALPGSLKALCLQMAPDPWSGLLAVAAAFYVRGIDLDWTKFFRPYSRRRVELPTYPFERKRYWIDVRIDVPTPSARANPHRDASSIELSRRIDLPEAQGADSTPPAHPPAASIDEARSRTRADALIGWLRVYANERVNSRLIDERRCIPPYIVLDLGNQGVLGMSVPERHGGLALRHRDVVRVMQQLAAIDLTLASFVGVHHALATRPILNFAQQATRDELLPLLAQGRQLGAFAITEPAAGSNPRGMLATATPGKRGGWRLSGEKAWIGTASWAGVINIFVQAVDRERRPLGITGFVLRQGMPGLRQGPEALTMGMRGMVQNSVYLDDVRVGTEHLLGEIGGGMDVAQDAMMFGRVGIAAMCVGSMKRCAQLMLRYAERRTIATGRLLDNPVTLSRLSELTAATVAVEALVDVVSAALDAAVTVPTEIYAACKTSGPEFLWTGADQLVQLLGARGYTETNPASQMLRDARLLRVFEGPTETLHMFLGSRVLKRSRALYEFIGEQLGAADVGRELDSAARTIGERFGAAGTLFRDRASAINWVHERTGVLATYAVLRAALQRVRARAAAPEIERALTWSKLRFDQTLRDIFAAGDGAAVLRDADALLGVVRDYTQSIGDVEQTLMGEAGGLDPLLRREHSSVKLVAEAARPTVGAAAAARSPSAARVPVNGAADSIQAWIIDWMAQRLDLARDAIRPQDPFAQFGWDSVDAVQLAHELGAWLQHDVEATLMWNFPTIEALAIHLAPLVVDAPVRSKAV